MLELVTLQQDNVTATLVDMGLIVLVSIQCKNHEIIFIYFDFKSLEFDCPADGTCSNQGYCDATSGTCVCDAGFEGPICQGRFTDTFQVKIY